MKMKMLPEPGWKSIYPIPNEMELKAIIVDDETDSRNVLKKLLQSFCRDLKIKGEAHNSDSAYQLILTEKPHVVFLDIQMPGGSGFTLLKKFKEISFEVIFVTSYDQYAIDAIKMSALDYLLKPVEVDDLVNAVDKVRQSIEKKRSQQQQIINVVAQIEGKEIDKKIAIHHNDQIILLPLVEITHFADEGNFTVIHVTQEKKYNSSKSLIEFEEMLFNYPGFLRISKKCMVNLHHISGYSKGEPCLLTLTDGNIFEISRRKKQEVLERIKK